MSQDTASVWSWWSSTSNREDEGFRYILTVLVSLFMIIWCVFFVKKQRKSPPLPPGPRGLPLVGYLPFLGSNLHHSFSELARVYGPIFRVKLGTKECIVVTSPSLVREVVRDQDAIFANRGEPTIASRSVLFGAMDIGFSDYGFEWRKMRKALVSEMLTNARFDATYHLRVQHVKKMTSQIHKKTNQLLDVGEIVFLTMVSSVMGMVWGDTLKGEEGSIINAEFRSVLAEEVVLLGAPNISDLFPLLARFDLQGIERRMKAISHRCERILDSAINHHITGENNQQKDVLGHLLQLNRVDDPSKSLTLPQIKAILLDVVVGATDTSSSMIEWAMTHMLQQPEVLRKVREELAEIVGLNNAIEEAHVPKLKYLKAVMKETLRLHPSLPMLVPHCPSEPSTIGGYSVPKGARVFLNMYAIQRDPQVWEDPLQFRPERFLTGNSADTVDYLGSHFQFLPFGSGRRMCPGVPLAERMSVLVLGTLVHAFQWKLPNDSDELDFSEKFGLVVKKAKPLIAIPSPRLPDLELYS